MDPAAQDAPLLSHSMSRWQRFKQIAIPVVLLTIVNVIFSGYVTLTYQALKGGATNAVVFAFLRDVGASAILMPSCYFTSRVFWPRPEHWGQFILLGFLGVWGAQLLSSLAISNLTALNYGLMTPVVPVVTTLFALLLGIDTFRVHTWASWAKVLGILVTVGGAMGLVAFSPNTSSSGGAANLGLGNTYLVMQKLCAGLYPLLQKHMLNKYNYPSLTLAAWAYFLGTFLIGLNVVTSAATSGAWNIDLKSGLAILYSAVLSSAFNYFTMAYVNSITSPVLVMSFYPLQAILTPILSWLFLGSTIYVSDILTGLAIITGLALCVWGKFAEQGWGKPSHSTSYELVSPAGVGDKRLIGYQSNASSVSSRDGEEYDGEGKADGDTPKYRHPVVEAGKGSASVTTDPEPAVARTAPLKGPSSKQIAHYGSADNDGGGDGSAASAPRM